MLKDSLTLSFYTLQEDEHLSSITRSKQGVVLRLGLSVELYPLGAWSSSLPQILKAYQSIIEREVSTYDFGIDQRFLDEAKRRN
jgi:hypothetical protein